MADNVPTSNVRSADRPRFSPPNNYYAYHDPKSSAQVSTTVIHALADVMGTDVTDTGFVLYDSVDPDALNRIFSSTSDGRTRPPGHVAFSVNGYRVTVYNSGHIVITPPADRSQ